MTLGEIIFNYRKKHSLSMDKFADLSGLSKGYISMLEKDENPRTGKPITPSLDTYVAIANAMYISVNDLFKAMDDTKLVADTQVPVQNLFTLDDKILKKKIPLLGTIAAGEPILAEQNIEDYVDIERAVQADFCLRVKGSSMINAGIQDGDIVFIRKQPDVEDGEIAAVLIDEEATLKRVFKFKGEVQLRAENPKFKPINLNGDKNVLILGKATYKLSKLI